MKNRVFFSMFVACLMASVDTIRAASAGDFEMRVVPALTEVEGPFGGTAAGTAGLHVEMFSHIPGAQGWQYGVILDPDPGVTMRITALRIADDLMTINGGAPAYFKTATYWAAGEEDLESVGSIGGRDEPNDVSGIDAVAVVQGVHIGITSTMPAETPVRAVDMTVEIEGPTTPGGGQPKCGRVRFTTEVGWQPTPPVAVYEGLSYDPAVLEPAEIYLIAVLSEPEFRRGDANADGNNLDLGDAVYILQYLFANGPTPLCQDAADANDDSSIDIGDGVYILQYLFADGAALPPPFEVCGRDETDDTVTCETFEPCK